MKGRWVTKRFVVSLVGVVVVVVSLVSLGVGGLVVGLVGLVVGSGLRPRRAGKPPGLGLARLCHTVFGTRTYEATFEAAISDMQSEYFAALHDSASWRARFVRIRFLFAFIDILIMWARLRFGKALERVAQFVESITKISAG